METQAVLSLQNPIATDGQLEQTPSRRDGVDPELEADLRIFACELIQSTGILLGLPQVAMATAQVLVQRTLFVTSLRKQNLRDITLGALFLASKVEEHPRRIRDIILVFDHVVKLARRLPLEPLEMFEPAFFELRNGLSDGEMHILRALGFNVHVQHAHGITINYLQSLGLASNRDLCQRTWNYLNDQLRTPVSVAYPVNTVACAAIWLAARETDIALPTSPPWWEVFDAKLEDLQTIAMLIKQLYTRKLDRTHLPLTIGEIGR